MSDPEKKGKGSRNSRRAIEEDPQARKIWNALTEAERTPKDDKEAAIEKVVRTIDETTKETIEQLLNPNKDRTEEE